MSNFITGTSPRTYAVTSNTQGYYKFNDNLTDSSTYGRNGTPGAGVTYPVGLFNKCLQLSGSTSVSTWGHPVIPNGQKNISFWFYDGGCPIYSGLLGTNYIFAASTGTTIYSNGDGNIAFQIRGGSGDSTTYGLYTLNSTGLVRGQWYHVVCQWDGTGNSNSGKIYVNGVLNSQSTNSKREADRSSYNLYTGRNPGDPTRFWYGYLEELIIENVVWSPEYVLWYYNRWTQERK